MHRNSQKRIYLTDRPYFITTNTKDRYPFFVTDIFCELFLLQLEFCKKQFDLNIYGYKINPEHIHLLFTPGMGFTISNVMKSLKKQTSHNINRILGYTPTYDVSHNEGEKTDENESAKTFSHFHSHRNINSFVRNTRALFLNHSIPKFAWQQSYHDHYIRGNQDLFFHLRYIKNQWIKHNLFENKWCFVKY